jgi:hypothetical protein
MTRIKWTIMIMTMMTVVWCGVAPGVFVGVSPRGAHLADRVLPHAHHVRQRTLLRVSEPTRPGDDDDDDDDEEEEEEEEEEGEEEEDVDIDKNDDGDRDDQDDGDDAGLCVPCQLGVRLGFVPGHVGQRLLQARQGSGLLQQTGTTPPGSWWRWRL